MLSLKFNFTESSTKSLSYFYKIPVNASSNFKYGLLNTLTDFSHSAAMLSLGKIKRFVFAHVASLALNLLQGEVYHAKTKIFILQTQHGHRVRKVYCYHCFALCNYHCFLEQVPWVLTVLGVKNVLSKITSLKNIYSLEFLQFKGSVSESYIC